MREVLNHTRSAAMHEVHQWLTLTLVHALTFPAPVDKLRCVAP